MDTDAREALMERLADALPKAVFRDNSMKMLLTDDAPGTLWALRMVAMIEAHRNGSDMPAAEIAMTPAVVAGISVPDRMTRCIAAFKHVHEWRRIRRAEQAARDRPPGRPLKNRRID